MFYRCTHVHSIHKSAFRKQDRTLFTGSHLHTSFSCVCLIHRRANILQVKHHVSWFTSRSSIASSNVHLSFTLAGPVQTVPPMQFIHAYHFHKCKPCSQVHIHFLHTPFNCSNVHIPLYDEITFEPCSKRSKSFLRNLVRSELLNP